MRIKKRSWSLGNKLLLSTTSLLLCYSLAPKYSFAAMFNDNSNRSAGTSSNTASLRAADIAFREGSAAVQRHDLKTAEMQFAKVARLSPGIAAGHSAYGSVLLALGKLQDATRELERAHQLDPAEPSAMMSLAYAYQEGGRPREALTLYDSMAGSPGGMSPEAYIKNAELLVATADLVKAVERVQQGVLAYPRNGALQDALGVLLTRQKNYEAGKMALQKAVVLEPDSGKAHLHLGSLYLLLQQDADALSALSLAIKLLPKDPQAHLEFGRALSLTGDGIAAIDELQKAHELAPSVVDISYALAVALQKMGRNQEALPMFEEAVAAHPYDIGMLTNMGLELVQLGRAKEGLAVYQRALSLSANDWVLQQDVGVAYLQLNDLDQAIHHFELALAVAPDNAQLHYDLGLAYKLKDKLPEAIDALRKAESEDASLSDAPYTLGVLFMQAGKFLEARGELEKATTLMPKNADAWSARASVDKSLNEYDNALEDYRTAIHLDPDDPGNHINLAAIYAQQGKHSDALTERKTGADLTRAVINKQKATFDLGSAKTLLQQGKINEAMALVKSAIVADPGNAKAHMAMAEILSQQGRSADAAMEVQKAHPEVVR